MTLFIAFVYAAFGIVLYIARLWEDWESVVRNLRPMFLPDALGAWFWIPAVGLLAMLSIPYVALWPYHILRNKKD